MRKIMFWVGVILLIFVLNFLSLAGQQYMAESYEYCNDNGYWVKTSFSGRSIGIAMHENGKPVTCEYQVEIRNAK